MKKIFPTFFLLLVLNFYFSAQAIDLPKYYKFPKNHSKGKFYDSVKDFFLVATKKNRDPRFNKTVILMLEHDDNGALGLVINAPLRKINLGHLISKTNDMSINKKELYNVEIPIYWGGPMDPNKILILHSNDYRSESTKNYNKLSTSNDLKTLVAIAENKGPKKSLVIQGISAWTKGQLDGEIEIEMWTLSDISMELIFETDNNIKWPKAISSSFIRL